MKPATCWLTLSSYTIAITLRNTVVYHTEKSLQKCLQLYTEWMLSYAQFMIINMRDPMREKWATPKMHDILHIILKIPERGTTDYHSCNAWVPSCPQPLYCVSDDDSGCLPRFWYNYSYIMPYLCHGVASVVLGVS